MSKIKYKCSVLLLKGLKILDENKYKIAYKKLLHNYGMDIVVCHKGYIDPSAYFDNYDYSKIHIGANVIISREVLFLTHDWSISTGLFASSGGRGYFLKDIVVKDNCFVGARSTLLPGAYIEENCIIGACSVVKGKIPKNSIAAGNPARVIGSIFDWTEKHFEAHDYIKD